LMIKVKFSSTGLLFEELKEFFVPPLLKQLLFCQMIIYSFMALA
jgi:hypothetical protein